MNFKKLNVISGWIAFAIATVVYYITKEPTTSFWDCGEFITTAFKQEVGHPPGAPLFMIIGRFFTLFGDAQHAAVLMNILSVIASAFTIAFLFWTITHLAKRLVFQSETPTLGQLITVLGSGFVGALAYTFSDTFWFSAVEAEVYGTSSLFTALVFWAILKWENVADQPHSMRWIVLICYLVGLSIGIHLLNLLAIPAIVFVYYYKNYNVTRNGIIATLFLSFVFVALIMWGIIPGIVVVASKFELFFVNIIGLPYNTGVYIYILSLIAAISYGIYYTIKKGKVLLNLALSGLTMIIIGYSCYLIIPIRSNADLPMDQNNPDNVFSLLSFLNREQYGDNPLVYGQYYNSPLDNNNPYVDGKVDRVKKNGKYEVSNNSQKPNYDNDFCTVFPRMWSRNDPRHVEAYKQWGKIVGTTKTAKGQNGEPIQVVKPTFVENMRFFFRYQVNFMYTRYLLWNFVGRQNDIQGNGEKINGNWISGVNFIDEARLGPQNNMPDRLKNNPGRNKYYFLPLILGIIGILFQYFSGKEGKRDLWIVFLLFFMTGLAIVVFLNQYPLQPRERDYAFAGSFYAFAIWIGLGVAGIHKLLKKYVPENTSAIAATALTFLLVPCIMASENWDDHDRSGRYSARDFGQNYLNSVAPKGIIFTNGDNDTYPLWYNQEVEGVGTDKRVCNLSYLQTDWYIDQMKRKAYTSDPLPISFTIDKYVQGTRDVVYIIEDPSYNGKSVDLGKALDFIKSDELSTKYAQADNAAYLPTRNLYYVVDKKAVIENGVVPANMINQIVDTMHIQISGSYLGKDQLMILDMLRTNNWKRPIYYAVSVGKEKFMGLDKYLRLEGLASRIVPIYTAKDGYQDGFVDTDIMYQNVMQKFKWGGLSTPHVYVDENNRRMCSNLRSNFQRLADQLIKEGKKEKAIEVLDKCLKELPVNKIPYDYFTVQICRAYFDSGSKEKAIDLATKMFSTFSSEINYFLSFKKSDLVEFDDEMRSNLYFLNEISNMAIQNGQSEKGAKMKESFESYYKRIISQ